MRSVPLQQPRNSHVPKALTKVARRPLPRNLGTPHSRVFSHWFDPMYLQRLQRNSALNRDAPVSAEFVTGKHWSNAAWPA
jgi:hypothetical protein